MAGAGRPCEIGGHAPIATSLGLRKTAQPVVWSGHGEEEPFSVPGGTVFKVLVLSQ